MPSWYDDDALECALVDAASNDKRARQLVYDRTVDSDLWELTGVQRDALGRLEATERHLEEVRRARRISFALAQ